VFTRRGGTSPSPWSTLNLGGTVGDDPSRVSVNRQLAFLALGRKVESVYDVWQVHSDVVIVADAPRQPHIPHRQADAILTQNSEVTLFMRFADCVPIFLYDPRHRAVGMVHAGWKGTVIKVAAQAVDSMVRQYRSNPAELVAGIGPSICPTHYEIGPEVVIQVQQAFGSEAIKLLFRGSKSEKNGKACFDLWGANRTILQQVGVEKVEVAEICTACNLEDWYSHRAERGKTGRFGALICP
jgi:hypothetical protein